ncbi:MAG: flippase-like domain-containing protein [Flavobacteriales bacterium]|nr:flippase-like domain-containing protein [Flavobacteriales bacterium]
MAKQRLIEALKIIIPVGLGLYLVIHIYNQLTVEQREELFQAFKKANYFWVILSFFMGLLSHWIRGYRWKYQLEAMGYKPRPANNFMAVMIGYIVNLALPRVGELSRAAAIANYENIPFQKSFGSILSERALDFIILMFITAGTILLQYEILENFAVKLYGLAQSSIGNSIIYILVGFGLGVLFLSIWVLKKYAQSPFIKKIQGFLNELLEGLRSIFKMEKRGLYLLATAAIWTLYITMFSVCFYALEETSNAPISAMFASFVLGSFAIVLIPGGIGAFPVGIMQALLLYDISAQSGFALGWILWFSQTSMVVIVGGLCMLAMPMLNKKKFHVQTPEN